MDTIKIEAMPGTSFGPFGESAREVASQRNVVLEYDFNGITVRVSSTTDIELLLRDYDNASYLNTTVIGPDCAEEISEGDRQKIEAAKEVSRKRQEAYAAQQRRHLEQRATVLQENFPNDGNQDALMRWVGQYADEADSIYFPREVNLWLANKLQELGYVPNDYVGADESLFQQRDVMAKWVLGQVLDCIVNHNMPPHPVTSKFVGDYFELRG